jgi:hypothetical protein
MSRLALALVVFAANAAAQFTVSNVTPGNGARGVSPAAVVTITFNAPVDPATVTAANFKLFGRWSGPVPCTLTVGGGGTTVTMAPQRPLFPTEIATLGVTRFVTSAASAPLTGGWFAMWWVDAAPSTGIFQLDHFVNYRLPNEGLIRTYGFFAGDVDRDGAPDMSATNEVSWDVRLLRNNGCGTFATPIVTQMPNGEEPSPNEGGDFDGDGWIDLATGNQNGASVAVLRNNGGGYQAPVVYPVGGGVHGIAVFDADSDGDTDIAATNSSNIALLRNNGNGTFAAPTFFNGGGNGEWSIAVADANNDGKPDLFCGTSSTQALALLLGDGNGGFTPAGTLALGGFPWQMAVGDVNGDGVVDCVVANASNGTARMCLGNGSGGLSAGNAYPVGSNPVSVDVGDLEGDDDLDVVVASFSGGNATIWRNNGNGTFANSTTLPVAIAGSCGVLVDHDRDGDTDIIVVDELDDKGFVFRQQGPDSPTAQDPSCAATLRVNNFATRAGYGGAPARLLPVGQLAFFGMSGGGFEFAAVFAGTRLDPGAPSPFGLLGLDLGAGVVAVVSSFLDANGELMVPVAVPTPMPPGATLTLQGVTTVSATGALVFSNPEQVVF